MKWGDLTKQQTREGAMPGPFKPTYDSLKMGTYVQKNYALLKKLFDPKVGPGLRQQISGMNEADLRVWIKTELDLDLPGTVRVMVVDIENARSQPDNIAETDTWYTLVLPPRPRKSAAEEHIEWSAWEGAWHHAIVDGYGM